MMSEVDMIKIKGMEMVRIVKAHVIASMYTNDKTSSYMTEVEIDGMATNSMVRAAVCICIGIVSTTPSAKWDIDSEFMNDV